MLRHHVLAATTAAALLAVPATAAAQDAPAPGGEVRDDVVTSFDGTPIEVTLFLPSESADGDVPLVLRTHGWGGSRERGGDGPATGTLGRLVAEGYAVLTWDSRGFGCSGGTVRIDDPDVEGRDVSALIDWALDNAPIATDADGDPIVGMSGGSYAGGVQMAAAAVDDRLDAFAPEIAWHDLEYSLFSGEVVNQGWVALLYGLGTATGTTLGLSPECPSGPNVGGLDPAIDRGVTEFVTAGRPQDDTLAFFAKSSLTTYGVDRPTTVPTLVMQGSVDTLFDLTDGHGIYTHVRDQGVDARFIAFCGGHVACPASYADAGDRAHLDDAIVAWFARHLKGEDVDTGPVVEYRTNAGEWIGAGAFPPADTGAVEVTGSAESLVVVPIVDLPDLPETLASLAAGTGGIPALPTTSSAPSADGDPRAATFEVATADGDLEVVGFPSVTLTADPTTVPLETALAPLGEGFSAGLTEVDDALVGELGPLSGVVGGLTEIGGLAGAADPRVHLHVKLVHREAGEVLNVQEGSIAVPTDGGPVTVDVPMPGLAYTIPDGDHLDLQVATHSLMHASGRVPALVDIDVTAIVPVRGAATDPTAPAAEDETVAEGEPAVEAVPTATTTPLPVTGGGLGVAIVTLLGAGLLRGRRRG